MAIMLIVGNGFDLHCGLNTRFSDYLDSVVKSPAGNSVFYSLGSSLVAFRDFQPSPDCDSPILNGYSESLTVWHILFLALRYHDEFERVNGEEFSDLGEWKDVENIIKKTLETNARISAKWETVFSLILGWTVFSATYFEPKGNGLNQLLAAWIMNSSRFPIADFKDTLSKDKKRDLFYSFLLKELWLFEKAFGNYVREEIQKHSDYSQKAQQLVDELCGENQQVIIESFNYTSPNIRCASYRNLHGTIDDPIIGVDATGISFRDPRYRFTKASRCLSLAMNQKNEPKDTFDVISRIVVYGHSLNAQDYTYFFNVLKTKKMQDPTNVCKLSFAYSSIPGLADELVKQNLHDSVADLINSFDEWMNQPLSTLEALNFQGKESFPFIE